MSGVADLMQAMADAGAPTEAIILAVRALEERDAEIERRKAGDRERKRRQRDKERDGDVNITGQSRDSHGDVPCHITPILLDKEIPPAPPLEINPPSGSNEPSVTPRARKAEPFALPSRIPAKQWDAYVNMRRAIGKKLTDDGKRLAVAKLDKLAADGWPPGEVLDQSTLNSWQGLFEIKGRKHVESRSTERTGGLEAVGRDVVETLRAREGNREPPRQIGSPDPGAGNGRVIALPSPGGLDGDERHGPPRMALGGL